jgi:nitric oxide reductase large subunit
MTTGMIIMVAALTAAATVQIYMERMSGLPFMQVQSYLGLFYQSRFWGGVVFIAGLVLFLFDVFDLRKEPVGERTEVAQTVTA